MTCRQDQLTRVTKSEVVQTRISCARAGLQSEFVCCQKLPAALPSELGPISHLKIPAVKPELNLAGN